MCVGVAHFVQETTSNANDQVVDETADCTERSNGLAVTVVDLNADRVRGGLGERDSQVGNILDELA